MSMLRTTPWTYQKRGVLLLEEFDGRAWLSDEMGLGKTLQTLIYLHRNQTTPAIVVCPASLKFNWEEEAWTHIGMRAEVLGSHTVDKGRLRRALKKGRKLFVVNYDVLRSWATALREIIEPKLVILDEAHQCANRMAKRTKATKRLVSGVKHLIAVSGTPLVNRPVELWPVLNMIHPERFRSFWSYAEMYCNPRRTPFGWDLRGSSNLDKLRSELSNIMIRRLKAHVLKDLPPKQRIVLPVPIDDPQEYSKAHSEFATWIRKAHPDKSRSALKAEELTKLGYLKRLAAKLKFKAVLEWIDNFLEESQGKLVVFGVHKAIIGQLHKRYHRTSVVITGDTSEANRKQAVKVFQTGKSKRIFLGNIKAAGVGLNLTAAHTVLFAELGWTPGEHTQAEDRVYARVGDLHGAQVYYMVGRGTIEEHLLAVIEAKSKVFSNVLDGGKASNIDIHSQLLRKLRKGPKGR